MEVKRPRKAHRQVDTNKCTYTENINKRNRERSTKKWRVEEQFITKPLTCTTKMTMPMVPSRCLLSSSHSSTFSKQPWDEAQACEDKTTTREKCISHAAGESRPFHLPPVLGHPNHPVHAFPLECIPCIWDIPSVEYTTRWGVKTGEWPMSGDFYMQTYGPHILLNVLPPWFIQGSLTGREVGVGGKLRGGAPS